MILRLIKARIRRYDKCRGFKLWCKGQKLLEIWYCPRGYKIIPHSHPNEHVELIPLFGWSECARQESKETKAQKVLVTPLRYFRRHTIPAGWIHWFNVNRFLPFVFLNFSTWKEGVTPTSAAQDFEVYAKT